MRMRLLAALAALFLAGCGARPAGGSPSAAMPSPSEARPPTWTPAPTFTLTPQARSKDGFFFLENPEGRLRLVRIDPDAGGGTTFSLPDDLVQRTRFPAFQRSPDGRWVLLLGDSRWYLLDLSTGGIRLLAEVERSAYNGWLYDSARFFSGDSRWLAFPSGSSKQTCKSTLDRACRIFLNTLDLATGSTVDRIPLLPESFPDNFADWTARLGETGSDDVDVPMVAFFLGLGLFDWSPDGRTLAFSGALDGPASEVYLLDMQTRAITRRTKGLLSTMEVFWTPDGGGLVYRAIRENSCASGLCGDYFYAPTGELFVQPVHFQKDCIYFSSMLGWVSPTETLCYSSAGRLVGYDLTADAGTPLFPGAYQAVALHSSSGTALAVRLSDGRFKNERPAGVFLLDPLTGAETPVDTEFACAGMTSRLFEDINAMDLPPFRFILQCLDGTVLLQPDGTGLRISHTAAAVSVSPDRSRILVHHSCGYDEILDTEGASIQSTALPLRLYTCLNDFQSADPADRLDHNIHWRPDGEAFFFLGRDGTYFYSLPENRYLRVSADYAVPLGWFAVK